MVKNYKSKFQNFSLCFFIFFPVLSQALNLGGMVSNSLQGEPLNADIELIDTPNNFDPKKVKIKLADNSQLWELGLSTQPYYSDMQFKILQTNDARWYIKVKTSKPIATQFVNFLLNVDYPQGHVVREYMAILKKPLYSSDESNNKESESKFDDFTLTKVEDNKKVVRFTGDSLQIKVKEPISTIQEKQQIASEAKIKEQQKAEAGIKELQKAEAKIKEKKQVENKIQVKKAPKNNSAALNKAKSPIISSDIKTNKQNIDATSIKVNTRIVEFKSLDYNTLKPKYGQTLWEIARDHATSGKNIQKMVMAIYQNNKAAFINNNINLLRQDIKLKIPREQDINKISYKEALDFMALQNNQYQHINKNITRPVVSTNSNSNFKSSSSSKGAVIHDIKINKNIIIPKKINNIITTPTKFNQKIIGAVDTKDPLLKIITAETEGDISKKVDLATERVISKQQENNELRQQIALLQAQLNDVKSLLAITKQLPSNDKTVVSPFTTSNIKNTTNNTKTISEVNKSSAISPDTNSSKVVNKNIQKAKESKTTITSIIGSFVNKLSRITKKVINKITNNEYVLFFKLSLLFSFILLLVSVIYSYWRKYYFNRPSEYMDSDLASMFNEIEIPEFDSNTIDHTRAVINNNNTYTGYSDSFDIQEDNLDLASDENNYEVLRENDHMQVTNKATKFRDNFDLVRAYIELNDYITARKILDEILKTGNQEQKNVAKQLIETLPAA